MRYGEVKGCQMISGFADTQMTVHWGSCIAGGFFTAEPPGDGQFDKWGRIKNPEREAYAVMKQLVLWLQIEIMDYVINKLIMLQ